MVDVEECMRIEREIMIQKRQNVWEGRKRLHEEATLQKDAKKERKGSKHTIPIYELQNLSKLQRDLEEEKEEHERTKTRLSNLMGQKLTDNNPNIADLSDRNRPTKLAERYSELYDNQWTDAFDILHQGDDKDTIRKLLNILREAFQYCRKEAETQLTKLCLKVLMVKKGEANNIVSNVRKQLKDIRKAAALEASRNVLKEYVTFLESCDKEYANDSLKAYDYLKECVDLCWLMNVQDPPVVIGNGAGHGEPFDTNLYKAYTKSGPLIEFEVWPPLYLSDGGNLLGKGVAQGYK